MASRIGTSKHEPCGVCFTWQLRQFIRLLLRSRTHIEAQIHTQTHEQSQSDSKCKVQSNRQTCTLTHCPVNCCQWSTHSNLFGQCLSSKSCRIIMTKLKAASASAIIGVVILTLFYTHGTTSTAVTAVGASPQHTKPAPSLESVLGNERQLKSYVSCLLDEGPCSREGEGLKQMLPDAIQTDCSKCTRVQRKNSRKVITFFRLQRPQDWKRLTDKYDPLGRFKSTRQ